MKIQFLLTSILALGMGVAQAQRPVPMQGGTDQSTRSPGQQPSSAPGGAVGTMGAPTTDTATAPQTFKGCLTGSSGNWTLAADNGQTLKVSGVDNKLSSFNNQQVNINGTQATDGTVKVVSIDKVSDSCNNSGQAATSSSMSSQPSTSSTNMSSTAPQPPASSTENTSTSNTQSTSTTTSNTGQSATTPSSTTPPPSSPDQNAASSSTGTSTQGNAAASTSPTAPNNDQNAGVGASGAASNQNAGQGATTTTGQTSDQSVRHISDMDENQKATGGQRLPQTASPLPLLGLMGLGSLLTGLVARRKK